MGQQLPGILPKKQSSACASGTTMIKLGLLMQFCACPHLPRDPFPAGSGCPVSPLEPPAALLVQQSGGHIALGLYGGWCLCIAMGNHY